MKHSWVRRVVDDFETNHRFQARFHLTMMTFWEIMTVVVILGYFFTPGVWLRASVLYLVIISHYANWDTDFDALSASQAAMHSQELLDRDGQR